MNNNAESAAMSKCRVLMNIEIALANLIAKYSSSSFNAREFCNLCLLGAIANIYFLANYSLSIDDEIAAVRDNPDVWLGQRRWTVYLVEKFIFPQPAIPFAPFVVLVVCLALSYSLLVRAHGYRISWKTYACYPVFVAFPTWWLISEFYSNVPAVGLGVLLVCVAVYLTHDARRPASVFARISVWSGVSVIAMLAIAIGAYQSLILLYICAVAGSAWARSMRSAVSTGVLIRELIKLSLQVVILVIAGGLLYAVVDYSARHMSGIHSTYIEGFLKTANFYHPFQLIGDIVDQAWDVYTGSAAIYGAGIPISALVIILAGFSVFHRSWGIILLRICLWAIVLGTPFVLHILSGASGMPLRSMLALAYVSWLMAMFMITHSRLLLVAIGVIVLGLYELQIVALTSQYVASASITQLHDQMLAADIYRRIAEQTSDFDRDSPVSIDVYGHKGVTLVYAKGWSSTTQASFFDWDGGNMTRMVAYMTVLGYKNIRAVSNEDRRGLTPLFREMPVWPASGSVKKVGQQYLVKLSHDPDPVHAAFGR